MCGLNGLPHVHHVQLWETQIDNQEIDNRSRHEVAGRIDDWRLLTEEVDLRHQFVSRAHEQLLG
jgi:hypothetical protein